MTKMLIHKIKQNNKIREKKLVIDLQLEILLSFIWKINKGGFLYG
ncbi:hypothetical protein LMG8526HA_01274 [Lactococcus lactis]|jgi:hypothetical protein|nr:hypothetical protein [Lactococcus lactis]